jgi:hypothetical protein
LDIDITCTRSMAATGGPADAAAAPDMLTRTCLQLAQPFSPMGTLPRVMCRAYHCEAGRRNSSAFAPSALVKCITALCIRLALAWVCGVGSCSHTLQRAAGRTAHWDILCCMRCGCDQTQHQSANQECLAVHDLRSLKLLSQAGTGKYDREHRTMPGCSPINPRNTCDRNTTHEF